MIEVSSVKDLTAAGIKRVALACGNFDGLHLGHKKIIDCLLLQSELHDSTPAVLTFEPHPREVLTGEKVYSLTSGHTKKKILKMMGVKAIIRIPFTKEFASKSAEDFVEEVLSSKNVKVTDVCIGSEWRFGKGREGDVNFLKNNPGDFKVHAVGEVIDSEVHISSSRIRQALRSGDFKLAEELLGRRYSVAGPVVKGRGIAASELSFPTANIDIYEQYLPLAGVYSCYLHIEGEDKQYPAVCNIGFAPTFGDFKDEPARVEVHILDFNDDIYSKNVEITFVSFLREEMKFSSPEDLKLQIAQDVKKAREIFGPGA